MNGVIGGACCKYTGRTMGYRGISSKVNLNSLGIRWSDVYPIESEASYRLIG